VDEDEDEDDAVDEDPADGTAEKEEDLVAGASGEEGLFVESLEALEEEEE